MRIWIACLAGFILALTTQQVGEAQSLHQQPYRVVETEGRAVIVGGNEVAAREAARADAVRQAVEQVVGVYLDATSEAEDFELVRDQIHMRSSGYAAIEQVLWEGAHGDTYALKARVKVFLLEPAAGKQALLKKMKELGVLRQLRVMVVIPETHLGRPHVPDPAAETAILGALIRAGFKAVDQKRVAEIRYSREIEGLSRGQTDPQQLLQFKKRFGADVLITGEAFSQRISSPIANDPFVRCRARVEVKAILTDTGEIIAADALHSAGADLSEDLASKDALQKTAERLAPRLISDILIGGYGSPARTTSNVEMEIRGWLGISQAQRFLDALRRVRGVHNVRLLEYHAGVLLAEVEADQDTKSRLGSILEEHDLLKMFGIVVESLSGAKIEGMVRNERPR